ncbi:MAG: hypothetical protein AAF669_08830 [Pseudomonadota bacterium]
MSPVLQARFVACDRIIAQCDIDYQLLVAADINEDFFVDYHNMRIVNSFLFNFSKLQDRIGAGLLKNVLYELKEIDTLAIPMLDVLCLLEKLEIIDDATVWDELREARNVIAHDYPMEVSERIATIHLIRDSYPTLKTIYYQLRAKMQQSVDVV